jgi:hypothetical protein
LYPPRGVGPTPLLGAQKSNGFEIEESLGS